MRAIRCDTLAGLENIATGGDPDSIAHTLVFDAV